MIKKFLFIFALLILLITDAFGQGLSLTGVGAKNRSFGGASVATPIDATGAIHWNPASMVAFKESQMELSLELLSVDSSLSSEVEALGLSGSTDSDVNTSPIPNFAIVIKNPDSDFTYGIGVLSVAGFRVNYASSATNPILTPQPNGLGRLIGEAEIFQVVPALAYQVNDKLSIGIAPTLSIARLQADPLFLASANTDGTYGPGADSDHHYGFGVQFGVFYQATPTFTLGAAIKSPQWFEEFRINSSDALGLPKEEKLNIDYPLIASVGVGYTGIEDFLFGLDVRYFDWNNTNGFENSGYDSAGALRGFGWDSTISIATGVQYQASEKVALRLGYNYGQNPIDNSASQFNVASPLIVEHIASAGLTYKLSDKVDISFAYLHGFENSISGPINRPGIGEIPGTKVGSKVSAKGFAGSLTVKF